MFTKSHKAIGNFIIDKIYDEYRLKIDKKAYLYGCIKPDISFEYMFIPHYKEKSFDYICGLINTLEYSALPKDKKELQLFSSTLGVITHYVTDYFCRAHNDMRFYRSIEHFLYEYTLVREFKNIDLNTIYQRYTIKNTLKDFLNEKEIEYLESPKSMYTDVYFSVNVCTNLVAALISELTKSIQTKVSESFIMPQAV